MLLRKFICLFLVCVSSAFCGINGHAGTSNGVFAHMNQIDSLSSVAYDSTVCVENRLCAFAGISAVLFKQHDYKSALPYLNDAYRLWKEEGSACVFEDSDPICDICNYLGLCASIYELNFEKSVKYYIEGIEYAKSCGNMSDYFIVSSNLVWIDYLRKDPAGIRYAEDMYSRSRGVDDEEVRFFSAYNVALMLLLNGEYEKAAEFLDEGFLYIKNGQETHRSAYSSTYAIILHLQGRDNDAMCYFEESLENAEHLSVTSRLYLYVSFGEFLNHSKLYRRAYEVLKCGIDLSESTENYMFMPQFYANLSETYSCLCDWKNAYESHIQYKRYSDSIYNINREWVLNELRIEYESALMEEEIQRSRIELMSRNRALIISIFSICLIMVVLTFVIILYRHRNRMYMNIVRQYGEATERETKLESEIERLKDEMNDMSRKYNAKTFMDQDNSNRIFGKIEEIMKVSHVYKDSSLTREKLAEMVGTNRTYVTRAISESTGGTFAQYLYSYRLKESVRILSLLEMPVPLKAVYLEVGFSSNNTFYKLFKEKIGMTPAQYRDSLMRIKQKKNSC